MVTFTLINEVLVNQKVAITEERLSKLLDIKSVSFSLPIADEIYLSYAQLIGKPNTRIRKSGVYIFTHIKSGRRYVGSSNSLSRRLKQYFNPNPDFMKQTGHLLSLVQKEG